LFAFDPWRQAILLVAGDKSTNWKGWYGKALKDAERLYAEHLRTQDQIQKQKQEQKKTEGSHDGHPEMGPGKGRADRRPRGGGSRR
jgi:hypothetical protein